MLIHLLNVRNTPSEDELDSACTTQDGTNSPVLASLVNSEGDDVSREKQQEDLRKHGHLTVEAWKVLLALCHEEPTARPSIDTVNRMCGDLEKFIGFSLVSVRME